MSGGIILSCARSFVSSQMISLSIMFLSSFQGGFILDMTYGHEAKGKQDRMLVVPKVLTEFLGKHVQKNSRILNGFPFRM